MDGAGVSGTSDKELEDRFEGLNLVGEEETDLDFSEEIDELIGDVRWLLIFRVHTTKPFSHAAMFKQMRNAWASAQEVTFKAKGENIFLAQFHCLGDWSRVMDGGPWLFRGVALVMAEYDGFTNVEEYKLDRIPVWTLIQGIPEGLMKKKELAEKVAKKVGEPLVVVIVNEGKINPSKYLRARVHLDLNKPLVRFVPITLEERKKYPVQYERLPVFADPFLFILDIWIYRLFLLHGSSSLTLVGKRALVPVPEALLYRKTNRYKRFGTKGPPSLVPVHYTPVLKGPPRWLPGECRLGTFGTGL
jgi:hypothetical protein